MGRVLCLCLTLLVVAGCSSSGPSIPTIGAARTFALSGFTPHRIAHPGLAKLSFTIRQPSGAPLTSYRHGAGPHTGVHLIVVRHDLGAIIHRHPPIGTNGRISQAIDFPTPGPYRVLVDAYPAVQGAPRNFQLHEYVHVGGAYHPQALPPYSPKVTVDGYHVTLARSSPHTSPRRSAIRPASRSPSRPGTERSRTRSSSVTARSTTSTPTSAGRRLRAVQASSAARASREPRRSRASCRSASCCLLPGPGGSSSSSRREAGS
ncbi:MAG: hypothetical protein E6G15_11390 [Actinobacteria bacterium]|nr:MAG: hypothetical protein E6G15_11390 [Actinomycetota bacterium]